MKWLKYIGIFMLFIAAAFFGMIFMAPDEVSIQVNEDISAPAEEVFDALSNHTHFKEWINGVKATRQIQGDGPGKNAIYTLIFDGEANMTMEHSTVLSEKDSRYAYRGVVADFMQVDSDTEIRSLDSNTTRVSTKITMKALSNKMKMFMYAEETHRKNAADNLTRLKDYLEK